MPATLRLPPRLLKGGCGGLLMHIHGFKVVTGLVAGMVGDVKPKVLAIWAVSCVAGGLLGSLLGMAGIMGIMALCLVGFVLHWLYEKFFGGPHINR